MSINRTTYAIGNCKVVKMLLCPLKETGFERKNKLKFLKAF